MESGPYNTPMALHREPLTSMCHFEIAIGAGFHEILKMHQRRIDFVIVHIHNFMTVYKDYRLVLTKEGQLRFQTRVGGAR